MGCARGCAEWVRVRVSSIVAEDAGLGLFVALPIGRPSDLTKGCSDYGVDEHGTPVVKRGTFVGLYRGKWMRRTTQSSSYRGARRSHAMETDDFFIVPPRAGASADAAHVNVYEYRIAAVQEVPQGEVANVTFVRWFKVGDVLETPPEGIARNASADSVAMYAARDLYDGEELFTFYGSGYPRTWVTGRPSHISKSALGPPRLSAACVPSDAWSLV